MPSYFKLRMNMSRAIESESKKACSFVERFYYRDATGRLAEVNVCEDGFVYRSPASFRCDLSKPSAQWQAWRDGKLKVPKGQAAPAKYDEIPGELLAVPYGAQPCPAADYEAALALVLAAEKKKEQERLAAKAAKDASKKGMVRNQHAAEEADVADPLLSVLPEPYVAPHFLADFTVIDLEFQGTDLLELAAIRYQDWQPVNQVQTFVRFRGALNYHVTNLTGITAADVWNAPEEKAVLQQFKQLAGDSLLVCHNLSADRRILEAARTRQGAPAPLPNEWFCTLALAKQRLPGRKHGLGDLCRDFGIASHGAHRALRDVEMCAGLLQKMHQMEPVNGPLVAKAKGKKAAAAQPQLFSTAA